MKNFIQDNFPENMTYDQLRNGVNETWDQIGEREFKELIKQMPEKCQAVIDAKRDITQW